MLASNPFPDHRMDPRMHLNEVEAEIRLVYRDRTCLDPTVFLSLYQYPLEAVRPGFQLNAILPIALIPGLSRDQGLDQPTM